MTGLAKMLRDTMTIARRDFVATVFTPTFLIFLAAPLIMLSFGLVGGLGASSMADRSESRTRLVAIASPDDARALAAADAILRKLYRRREAPPQLVTEAPQRDPAAQAHALLTAKKSEATAVLYGPLATPTILHAPVSTRHAAYLAQLAEDVLESRALAGVRQSTPTLTPFQQQAQRTTDRGTGQAAFFAVFGIFILTLMLAGQVIGTMAEERSNKVIEILAAAVPLESVFLGKLVGMFGVAVLFVTFWGTVAVNVGKLAPAGLATAFAEMGPAVGPIFALLFVIYFSMSYLLLGAVFLTIGAQASTPRELQLLTLPVTIFMVAMFGIAQVAAAKPDGWIARVAEIFPFSSPFAMAGRAANKPELWPHLLAIGWQALWVAVVIWLGARLFRRGVLQSGSPPFWKRRRGASAA